MAKPKIPSQKNKYGELNKRLAKYISLIESVYDTLNMEAAKLVDSLGIDDISEDPFSFSGYPETNRRIDEIQKRFVDDIEAVIYRGTSDEWKNSNEAQDLMANKVLKAYNAKVDGKKYKVLYQANSDALKAFQNRKDKGFNVSEKLWNQSVVYKKELEDAISCAIEKGMSAVTLSKRISKYLLDFPQLQKDYKEKFGRASTALDCECRSIRLAASEINMAYRTAENERWKQMDFVVGYEIKLSGNHTLNGEPFSDICDHLAGKYPKDFVWTGWHPLCRCYKIPILKTEEEFWAWDGRSDVSTKSVNEVKDVPDNFKQWVGTNAYRIEKAKDRGTLPYFIKDNPSYINGKSMKQVPVSTKPFKFDKSTLKQLKNNGFSFEGESTVSGFNKSAISGVDLISIDKTLSDLFKENKINITKRSIDVNLRGNVELSYIGEHNGEEFRLIRFFAGSSKYKEVQHSLFILPKDLQGRGISKKVLSCFYKEYKKAGIAKINVHANIDVGGYTWAKYGFAAEKRDVDDLITYFKTSRKDKKHTKEIEDMVRNFYSKNDVKTLFPMNLISEKTYGKDMLLDSSWYGVIDMNDAEQIKIFEKYLFR